MWRRLRCAPLAPCEDPEILKCSSGVLDLLKLQVFTNGTMARWHDGSVVNDTLQPPAACCSLDCLCSPSVFQP